MSESDELENNAGSKKADKEETCSKSSSIQQILEGMTNEFNKTGQTKRQESAKKNTKTESPVRKQEKSPAKVVEETAKTGAKAQKCINHVQEEVKVVKENIPEKKSDKLLKEKETTPKQESANKKDGNVPARIVLTFRTIDENTDHGKKTKISSCPSNLTLVPDEFTNCDQIGGVSVKIENFDEACNDADKSDATDGQAKKAEKGDKSSSPSKEKTNKKQMSAAEKSDSEKANVSQETAETNSTADDKKTDKDAAAQEEKTTPVTRKGRGKRQREFSDESVLKRSARRLSKESFRSTVLESAMARKEKSNYTPEPTKRKYNRPGRPRKNFPEKKAPVPKLTPLEPPPKLTPIEPPKALPEKKKDNIPKLTPINPPKPMEPPKPIDPPKPVDPPKPMKTPTPIETPKPTKTPTPIETPKPTESPKPVDPPKSVDLPKPPMDPPKTIDPPKPIDPPMDPPKSIDPPKAAVPPRPASSPKPAVDKKDSLPKLNPIIPPKLVSEKKNSTLPKLSPLKPIKHLTNNVNGSASSNVPKLNKYTEMPKLTPIIKNTVIMKSKFHEQPSNSNASLANESLLRNSDGPFLKPATMKSKRDRIRSSPVDAAASSTKKMAKTNSFSGLSPSSESASSIEDYAYEENVIPTKKIRRSMTPSPNTADGVASKPESAAVMTKARSASKKVETAMQCLCEVRPQLFVTITSADAPLYCTAVDSIDHRVVGCRNKVDRDDVAMRRPSARIPYIILCRVHKDRLIRHNCCPSCGLFCSQGRFVHCANGHQYHRGCELYYDDKPLCPHCASHDLSQDVIMTVAGQRKPASVPQSKPQPRKEPAAKITLPGSGDNAKLAEQKPSLKKSTEPLISPDLIRIPEANVTDKTERYTLMSLYNSVKSGELQKLVNVLACGFNPNHVYRDQGHRTSLHFAADKGFLGCVHVLVQAGAQLDVLDRNQLSPLMLASTNGNVDVVRYLMRIGADVTLKGEDGMTALHMAARAGHLEVCKVILSECKVPRTLVDSVDDGGWTSLIWASEFRHVKVAEFLLDNKCDPLIRDAEQNIALHWSAYSGSHEITEMLLNLGCDANVVNIHGDTPLHIASRRDQYSVCVLLLSRGARIVEKNALGETAIDCCTGIGDTLNVLRLNFKVNQNSDNGTEKTVRILTNDITRGKEANPVQCVNGVDSEDKPTDFVYVTENCFTSRINVDRTITSLQSCRCEDNCGSDKCLCGNISLRCWYSEEGKLVPEFNYSDPPMLFECNPACDCNKISCNNRVVQHGMTQRFQLFRTEGKGWGLRTLRPISKGTYVCEYVGEIISDSQADLREDDSYLFDLDNRDGETYCIDARRYGNLARFINHSCAPNLLPVRVFIEHQDLRFPRIAFFANRDIEADEELGFDYGEKFWIIKYKSFTCTCGAENCRYSDKTIQITLNNYRQRLQVEDVNASAAAVASSAAKSSTA